MWRLKRRAIWLKIGDENPKKINPMPKVEILTPFGILRTKMDYRNISLKECQE
jgi:hypothetical protein